MSADELNTFMAQFTRAIFDPTAPVPSLWPGGAWGVFLIFTTQIGAGIPLGVIMARNAGLPPLLTAGLYLASDVVLAFTVEPMLAALRWLGQRVEFLGRVGNRLARFSGMAGLQSGGVRGPLGLILFSFTVAPAPARAASEAAGYGFVPGWTLAIIGDMAYFALMMVSTLWISSMFGDDRLTVGAVLLGTWLIPMVIRRLRRRASFAPSAGSPRLAMATARAAPEMSARPPRKGYDHTGRRQRAPRRGLHR
jgi:hypothetical protein